MKTTGLIEQHIKNAIMIGLNRNIGTNYFDSPEERLKRMLMSQNTIPTKWFEIDENLNGGLNRKELTLFAANAGVGKSMFMANLAVNYMEQKLNVVYITLELSEEVVAKRFDSMTSGYSQAEIFKNIQKVAYEVENKKGKMGSLFIKRMPESTTTCNDIRAFLKDYETINGYMPDVLVVDYLDLLASNQRISVENMFIKDKFVTEELRSIANDLNLIAISACQLGRSALETKDHNQGHIQGGMSKVNTTDNLLAIIQTDIMKAAGEYVIKFLKTRSSNGVGKSVLMKINGRSLRITNGDNVEINKYTEKELTPTPLEENDILNLMNI